MAERAPRKLDLVATRTRPGAGPHGGTHAVRNKRERREERQRLVNIRLSDEKTGD